MSEPQRTTVVLLAGGRATRLPGKLELRIDGEPLAARVYRRLCRSRACIVSIDRSDAGIAAALPGATFVTDAYPQCGPLGGLASAATAARTPLLFAAAADMPNLEPSFIERLEDRFDSSVRDGMQPDAVLPVWPDGRTEPLAALYSSTALRDAATAGLKAGVRKVMAAVERLRVVTYPLEAGDAAMLANVNTPSDYEAFLR